MVRSIFSHAFLPTPLHLILFFTLLLLHIKFPWSWIYFKCVTFLSVYSFTFLFLSKLWETSRFDFFLFSVGGLVCLSWFPKSGVSYTSMLLSDNLMKKKHSCLQLFSANIFILILSTEFLFQWNIKFIQSILSFMCSQISKRDLVINCYF